MSLNRRDFLFATLAPALASLQPPSGAPLARQRDSRLLGTLPLGPPGGRTPPFGQLLGNGLDARLFTDLSGLSAEKPDALVTPNDRFYVRTAAPDRLLPSLSGIAASSGVAGPPSLSGIAASSGVAGPPSLNGIAASSGVAGPPSLNGIAASSGVAGRPDRATSVPAEGTEVSGIDFARLERVPGRVRVGPYLMECAGNSDPTNFGLMSVAAWTGFSMPAIIEQLGAERSGQRVLISGADPAGRSLTSVPGASWIFSRDQLERAVLAVGMNDAPLPVDHGGAARLLVPGWYGCACVKWVNRIELVPDEAPATTQMLEFAARTHQPFDSAALAASLSAGPSDPRSLRARDFIPAAIDTAAMPVRVEKWLVGGRLEYRITGIIWGGSTPTNALSIRFKSGGAWTRVEHCPLPQSTLSWSLWTHTWRPNAPGRYQIVLRVDDQAIRTRRLDIFFYVREVQIDET